MVSVQILSPEKMPVTSLELRGVKAEAPTASAVLEMLTWEAFPYGPWTS